MSSLDFYKNMAPFQKFSDLTEDTWFQTAPDDWCIVITDIAQSTAAIAAGRYRDVNTLGVASIVCVQNALKGVEFPYVFGGDGATILIPSALEEKAISALSALQRIADQRYGLSLRVGTLSMMEIREDHHEVHVGKFQMVGTTPIAILRGSGLDYAEKRIKSRAFSLLPDQKAGKAVLEGLSCRWQPLPPHKDLILCVIIQATDSSKNEFKIVLDALDRIFEGDLDLANPVNIPGGTYKSLTRMLQDESRLHARLLSFSFWRRCGEILLSQLLFGWSFPQSLAFIRRYKAAMKSHSDFKKLDGMLRMVLDCSLGQKKALETFLAEQYNRGHIFYGLFASKEALMTCFVESLSDGGHIHFIDGTQGGYTLAAKQMKEQIRKKQSDAA